MGPTQLEGSRILCRTVEPNLSRRMRQLNGRSTHAYNRQHRRVGCLLLPTGYLSSICSIDQGRQP